MGLVDSNWTKQFSPLILRRGRNYFEEGRVGCIERIDDTYFADVEGSENYGVEITLQNGIVEEMFCSCPYAETGNCKHMAAVLFSLEIEDTDVEKIPSAPTPPIVSHVPLEIPWLEAVDNLPEETVRKELLKLADREDRLKERLAVLYLGKLPEGQLQNWKADLQQNVSHYMNRRGWIMEEDAWEFTEDLCNFLNTHFPLLLEINAIMDAFHLVWIVMETALEWPVDNSEDDVDRLLEDCEESLRKVYLMATNVQRKQMTQWYQEHRDPRWPGGVENMDRIFQALEDLSVSGIRIVEFAEGVPYFLYEDQWFLFPKRDGMYYDFVEDTALYKEVEPIVEAMVKEILGERFDYLSNCRTIWDQQKRLLMEKYGIEWLTPAELNPEAIFD